MHIKVLIFTLITIPFFLYTTAKTCPPGTWKKDKPIYLPTICIQCDPGNYCPGDGFPHLCSTTTYAPKFGMSACLACPPEKPISSYTRDYCLPADTPKYINMLDLSVSKPDLSFDNVVPTPFYTHDAYDVAGHFFFGDKQELLVLNFIIPQGSPKLNAYFSTKSGDPSPTNYEVMATGGNLTFILQKIIDPEMLFFIKFEIPGWKPQNLLSSPMTVLTSPVQKQILSGQSATTYTYSGNYTFFETYIETTSCINITITIAPDDSRVYSFGVYASIDKSNPYPSVSHYQWKNSIQPITSTFSVSLLLESLPPGPLYFSASSNVNYNMPYTITALLSTINCKR